MDLGGRLAEVGEQFVHVRRQLLFAWHGLQEAVQAVYHDELRAFGSEGIADHQAQGIRGAGLNGDRHGALLLRRPGAIDECGALCDAVVDQEDEAAALVSDHCRGGIAPHGAVNCHFGVPEGVIDKLLDGIRLLLSVLFETSAQLHRCRLRRAPAP